jgi:hypothetical protein
MIVLLNVNAPWQVNFSFFDAENSAARLAVFTLYVHFGFSSILSLFLFCHDRPAGVSCAKVTLKLLKKLSVSTGRKCGFLL